MFLTSLPSQSTYPGATIPAISHPQQNEVGWLGGHVGEKWFTITHALTLTEFAWPSVPILFIAIIGWFWQLTKHEHLEENIQREAALSPNAASTSITVTTPTFQRLLHCLCPCFQRSTGVSPTGRCGLLCVDLDCSLGCCWCWSTAGLIWIGNCCIITSLAAMCFWGIGAIQHSMRSDQASSCRIGLPPAMLLFVLDVLVLLMYTVLLSARFWCSVRLSISHRQHDQTISSGAKVGYAKVGKMDEEVSSRENRMKQSCGY